MSKLKVKSRKIQGLAIRRLRVASEELPVLTVKLKAAHGEFWSASGVTSYIKLHPGSRTYMAQNLWHESIHAVSAAFGLSLTEKQTRALEHGLAGVLRDNPEFTRALLARPKNGRKV